MLRRMRWIWLAAALLATSSVSAKPAAAATFFGASFSSGNVSVSYFYDALSPYGRWMNYSPYGYVWTPTNISYGWRPYSDGDWVYTDYGWTWVDNEPWGWGPMHYGRWVWADDIGWVWVPGTTWAPAWVAWASDADWVGWAPLPPDMGWSASVSFTNFNVRRLPSTSWCFVDRRDLASSSLRSRILPVSRNGSIVPRMQNVTRFASRGGRPVNFGPDVHTIERMSGRPVTRMHVADLSRPTNGRTQRSGNELRMFRGHLAPAPANAAPKRLSDRSSVRDLRGNTGGNPRANMRGRDIPNQSTSAAQNQQRQRFDLGQAMQNRGPSRRPTQREWQQQRSQANDAQQQRNDQARRVFEQNMQRQHVEQQRQARPQQQAPQVAPETRRGGRPQGGAPQAQPSDRGNRGGGRPQNGGNPPPSNDNGHGNGGGNDQPRDNGRGNGNGHGRGHGE